MPDSVALELTSAGLTDVGRVRARNEDCFGVDAERGLAVVCDGMGGHAGGDIASRTATDAIVDFLAEFAPAGLGAGMGAEMAADAERTVSGADGVDSAVRNAFATVRSAVRLANQRLTAANAERGFSDGRGMGTTVVGLWWLEGTDRLVVFHAGDSRLYRLRGGELEQLTRDHSLYQVWLDQGGRGPAPQRNIIVRALGTAREVDADVAAHAILPGDLYLLCSDGLSGMLPDAAIAAVLRDTGRGDLADTCRHLVALANERGGQDNITAVAVRFDAAG